MAAGHVRCIKFATIAYSGSNDLPGVFDDAHGACPTFQWPHMLLKYH